MRSFSNWYNLNGCIEGLICIEMRNELCCTTILELNVILANSMSLYNNINNIIYIIWWLPGVSFFIDYNKFYTIVYIFIYYTHKLKSRLITEKVINNDE